MRLLAAVMLFGLAPVALAAPANVYDKYRNVSYSNKGLLSESQEVQVGAQVHQEQVLQKFQLVDDPALVGYVEELGRRIAQASARPDLDYHFFVVDDPSVNAFSIPGGFIYVHTGLLRLVGSEDELAAVMAHEVAHVVARHGLRNLKSAQRAQIGVGIASILGSILTRGGAGGRAIGAGAQIFAAGQLTKHSRDFEREADYLGLYNVARAGYQPNGMIGIFQKLGQSASSGSAKQMGGIFASHPDSGERVKNTEAEITQHLARRMGDERRPRSAGQSSSEFAAMKGALGRSGQQGRSRGGSRRTVLRRGERDDNYPGGRRDDGSYDDSGTQGDPATYEPPPLRRQPPRP